MGTVVSIVARGECPKAALDAAFDWFGWVDRVFSPYRSDSPISRLGRGEITLDDCPPQVATVLGQCEQIRLETGGFFDVHADPRWPLDPSGFVKGWSAAIASECLATMGAVHHAVNAGGDVCVRAPDGHPPWQVGIVHPLLDGELTASVDVSTGAVATSGTYERGCHIFDPHTGAAAIDLAAVTVVGPDLGRADAYATAALAMGPDRAPLWLNTLVDFDSFVVDASGDAWWSPGFAGRARGLPSAVELPSGPQGDAATIARRTPGG